MGRLARGLLLAIGGVALVGVGWWAAGVAMQPPANPLTDREPLTYTVAEETVERSLRFSTTASWRLEDLGRNPASGIVTSIEVAPGESLDSGDILYTVNLRPVVVAEGEVPSFRPLSLRSEGSDVAQLQFLLADLGFYADEPDGVFDAGVRDAVRRWQASLGVPDDGVVQRGDLLFINGLPARVLLDSVVMVGLPLVGGEVLVRRVLEEVDFQIVLSGEQRNVVPLDAAVNVSFGNRVWRARVHEAAENQLSGEVVLVLEAANGGPVCGGDCFGAVPLSEQILFPAEVLIVPETTGPAVPVAAIVTLPNGSTVVRLHGGGEAEVSVVATANGIAVVEGLDVGQVVVLPVEGGQ